MIWFIALGSVFLILMFLYWNNHFVVFSRHTVPTENAEGRVVHLSDIHSCRFTEKLYRKVRGEMPTLIIITGDLWDRSKKRIGEMTDFAERLCEICPVVYVPGNHEFHDPGHEYIFREMKKRGVCVLRHNIRDFDGVSVLGMDHLCCGAFTQQELNRLEKKSGFRIVAVHYPQLFEEICGSGSADLMLAGHAHGGQARIPFLKKGIYSPDQGFFPKYSEGMHEKNGSRMIVSRGIGNSRFPFRLFNLPEIVVIDLKRK